MKGAVVIWPFIAIAILVGIWPAANALASNESQTDPHAELERARARRHLRTNGIGPNSAEYAVAVPGELAPFVRSDEIPLYIGTADLEKTGRLDYVLVVGTEDSGDKTMRIISRAASGALSVILSRNDVIVCDECGGMDRGASIGLGKGAIELSNASGDAYGGHETLCLFRYSRTSNQWLLVDSIDFEYSENGADTSVLHQTAKDFGAVSLADARLSDHCY